MTIARYRKAIAAAVPTVLANVGIVLSDRFGLTLSAAEMQLILVVVNTIGIVTTGAVFTIPNAKK